MSYAQYSIDTSRPVTFALSCVRDRPKIQLTTILVISVLIVAPIFSSWNQENVYASTCSLLLTQPSLKTIYSSTLAAAKVGEQFVITTTIASCLEEKKPFVVLVEVRNSDGITEQLGWQSGDLKGLEDSAEIGLSWVPIHGGSYELGTFAISSFQNPQILSAVMTTDISIEESPGKAVIAIPYDPDPAAQGTTFQPSSVKVIIGVNNTVAWTNGDNASHRLIGDPNSPNPLDFDGEHVFLYPGYTYQHIFTQAGSFHYVDADREWMRGIVWVIPHDAVNAYLNFSINGLKDSYKLDQGEPVEFSVGMSGFDTGCGSSKILIERIDEGRGEHPFDWSTGAFFDCFNVASPYRSISLHFPDTEFGPVYQLPINQTGTYRLTASFDTDYTSVHYSFTRDFLVT